MGPVCQIFCAATWFCSIGLVPICHGLFTVFSTVCVHPLASFLCPLLLTKRVGVMRWCYVYDFRRSKTVTYLAALTHTSGQHVSLQVFDGSFHSWNPTHAGQCDSRVPGALQWVPCQGNNPEHVLLLYLSFEILNRLKSIIYQPVYTETARKTQNIDCMECLVIRAKRFEKCTSYWYS